ncbi:DUF4271 domain-containing protein [Echinicola arenosa]|nr:DUF4271 domain-containing protein [Echinicola arenosa]
MLKSISDILEDFNFMKLFARLFLFCFGLLIVATVQGQVLENYNPKISIKHKGGLLPSPVMAAVELDITDFPKASFDIQVPKESAVFLGDKLWFYTKSDTNFITSMKTIEGLIQSDSLGKVELLIYKSGIDEDAISIKKGIFKKASGVTEGKNAEGNLLRIKDEVKDFLIVALIVILALVAIFKVTYPLVFQSALRPVAVFSDEFSDSSSGGKVFSSDVLFYLLVFSMLVSLFIMSAIHFMDVPLLEEFLEGNLNYLFLVWLSGTAIFMVLSFLKYFWIKLFAVIYQLDRLDFSQFFYLVRGLLIVLLFLFVVIFGFYLQGTTAMDQIMNYAVTLFLLVYLLGIFRLFYLMLKKVPFKSYHLFSYLCTSEMVPFLLIVKIVMG